MDDCGRRHIFWILRFLVVAFGGYLAVAALVKNKVGSGRHIELVGDCAGKYSYLHLRCYELE